MTHSEIRARLSEYLERDLPSEQRSRIGAHLESCADCDREFRDLRATVSLLRGLPEPELPAGIGGAVMARIARGEGREARVYTLFRRAAEPRFAAPLAAGLAGLFFLFQAGDSGFSPKPALDSGATKHAEALMVHAMLALADGRDASADAWRDTVSAREDHRTGLATSVTPAAAVQQYMSLARMDKAMRRTRSQEFAQKLRGAGHPNSASLATHFESRSNVVLADWRPR